MSHKLPPLLVSPGGFPYNKEHLDEKDAAIRSIRAELDGWRKIVGEIAALVPLPYVLQATGTTADLIAWIKEQVEGRKAAEARLATAEKALEPFAEFGRKHTADDGWNCTIHRGSISTWFGASDFRRAREALASNAVREGDDG